MSARPIRKKGQSNKSLVMTLSNYIDDVHNVYAEKLKFKDLIISQHKELTETVSKAEHDRALAKVEELRIALKKYGLWTGQ